MLTRQKIIIWLQKRVPYASDTKIMKLLFITKNETSLTKLTPFYDFMPYHYGPFSYVVRKDLNLAQQKLFADDVEIPSEIQIELEKVLSIYGRWDKDLLMAYVYNKYPYFASRSKVKEKYLSKNTRIPKPKISTTQLHTIYYEERSIDEFLNELISNSIDVLVDVRKNAASMKYGFRGANLTKYAQSHGFGYVHLPQLGIDREKRDELGSLDDYKTLFAEYEKTTLRKEITAIEFIEDLIRSGKRVALVCFEKDTRCCHRVRLAQKLSDRLHMPVCHI